MQLYQRTEKEQKAYERTKDKQILKRKIELIKAKLLRRKLAPKDKLTIQAQIDSQGNYRDYYISDVYLQNEFKGSYICVSPILEDEENHRFIYKGLLITAKNALGIIESNVPLSEIVSSPYGNIAFQEMLSEDNALQICQEYYNSINESLETIPGGTTYLGKPTFPLGRIIRDEKGHYVYDSEIGKDIKEQLSQEVETDRKMTMMREKENVEIDIGGIVVAKQDCWMERGENIKFCGINRDALFYEYEPERPIKTADGKFVYIGDLKIGESQINKSSKDQPIQFISPFIYHNVCIWTESKNILQYFLNNKLDGLNFALGEIFTNEVLEKAKNAPDSQMIIGGISLNVERECIVKKEVPESVKDVVYGEQKENKKAKIVNFEDRLH